MGSAVRHVREAENILMGYGFSYVPGTPSTQFPPGYAFLLAGTFALFGKAYIAIWLLHISLGVAVVWLTYCLAKTGLTENASLLAATIVAIYPSFIFDPITLVKEIPYTPLFLLAVYWSVRGIDSGSPWHFALSGLSAGVATYFRAEIAGFVVVAALLLVLFRRARWQSILLLVGLFGIVVFPWTMRNSLIHHRLVFLSTLGGYNLYVGNNATTPVLQSWRGESTEAIHRLNVMTGGNEYAQDTVGGQMALQFIAGNPAAFVLRGIGKVVDLWGPDRLFFSWYRGGLFAIVMPAVLAIGAAVISAGGYVVLLLSAVIAAFFSKRRTVLTALSLALFAYTTAVASIMLGHPRFHWPLVPFLAILAAIAITERATVLRSLFRPRRNLLIAAVLVILVLTVQFVAVVGAGDLARTELSAILRTVVIL